MEPSGKADGFNLHRLSDSRSPNPRLILVQLVSRSLHRLLARGEMVPVDKLFTQSARRRDIKIFSDKETKFGEVADCFLFNNQRHVSRDEAGAK